MASIGKEETEENDVSMEVKDGVIGTSLDDGSSNPDDLIYGIEERPPWLTSIVLALQHFATSFPKCVVWPVLFSKILCMDRDPELMTRLIATMFLVTGIGTILQCLFGSRLPILQGPAAGFFVPMMAMLQTIGQCPATITVNSTDLERQEVRDEAYARMQQVQGTLLFASLVQAVVGFSGLIGVILRFIGPICIGVTIFTVGISLIRGAMILVQDHWCISIPTIALVVLFSTVLHKVAVPLPGGKRVRIFAMFPMSLAIVIMWIVCAILTYAGIFPDDDEVYGYAARVDVNAGNLRTTHWFSLPYPGQWGLPTFNAGGLLGILSAVLASVLDSVADYHACAQVAGVPPPPVHAVNRGVGVEAFGVFMGGLFGTVVGVTSHSGDIAVVKLTKVASRTVMMGSGLVFALLGFLTKFSAFVHGIPTPVLSAMAVPVGMMSVLGMANFKHVNMENSRNILVIGLSIFAAIGLPAFFQQNHDAVNTGSATFDTMVAVLFSNAMFVGAVISALLDNMLPGSYTDRGMDWESEGLADGDKTTESVTGLAVYNLPFGMDWIRRHKWMRRVPFSPTFLELRRRNDGAVGGKISS